MKLKKLNAHFSDAATELDFHIFNLPRRPVNEKNLLQNKGFLKHICRTTSLH